MPVSHSNRAQLVAVDLTNVRPDQKKRIGLFGGKEVEIFSPTYALRFMAALEAASDVKNVMRRGLGAMRAGA